MHNTKLAADYLNMHRRKLQRTKPVIQCVGDIVIRLYHLTKYPDKAAGSQ